MKENLQKRILLPFIIFSVGITLVFVGSSSYFMAHYFSKNETDLTQQSAHSFSQQMDQLLNFNASAFNQSSTLAMLKTKLKQRFPASFISHCYDFIPVSSLALDLPKLTKQKDILLEQTATGELLLIYRFFSRNRPSAMTFSLTKYLSTEHYQRSSLAALNGFVFLPQSRSSVEIITTDTSVDLTALQSQFQRHLSQNAKSKTLFASQTSSFLNAKNHDSLFYFSSRASTLTRHLLFKLIAGLILVVTFSTLGLYSIYSLIIQKMTTSIDILRAVSKKVANGNFTEKVFIDSNDEIGELAAAFNQMIVQLNTSTKETRHHQEQSDAIITCIPDGIIVTNFKNQLLLANKKAENVFAFKSADNNLAPIETCIQHKTFREHSKQVKKTTSFMSEFIYTQGSEKRVFAMRSTVVHNIKHKPIGIVYLIRDITHEKQIEELREGFLRTVSHELRTPLTSVIGFIELVLHSGKDSLTNEQLSCLGTALQEAGSLKLLINDLLELSQMQAKQSKLNSKQINIHSFVNSITHTLSPLTKGKSLELINAITKKSLSFYADEAKLRRIFVNLISNGIKFTEKGHIKISCVDMSTHIEFCVSDTGIGLKSDEVDVIFEKFRQVDYSSTREYEGIGLGLSIVKELVELHGGHVRVESVYGKGSNFYFTIEKATERKRDLTVAAVT